jgi:menaquinone-dependent protoporphyrinogen oxidase
MSGKSTMSRRDFLLLAGGTICAAVLPCNMVAASDGRKSAVKFIESMCGKDGEIQRRILIAYASRCGSTGEVADGIGQTLCETGVSTEVRLVGKVRDLSPYQSVILGSAVRAGKWLPEAADFVKKHQDTLCRIPVAYFVVCMTMRDDTIENRRRALTFLDPLYKLAPRVKPRDIGLFAGATDFNKLSFVHRSILKAKGIPEGDFRNWEAIRTWAVNVQPVLLSEAGEESGNRDWMQLL